MEKNLDMWWHNPALNIPCNPGTFTFLLLQEQDRAVVGNDLHVSFKPWHFWYV